VLFGRKGLLEIICEWGERYKLNNHLGILMELKLVMEIVPSQLHYKNPRTLMGDIKWRELKNSIFAKEGRKCWICSSPIQLELHEFFDYDERKKIQKLKAFHHLCKKCHIIKHPGFWFMTPKGRSELIKLNLSKGDIINHFCKVNGCSKEGYEKHEKESWDIFHKRNKIKWKQDFSEYL
jgi:hypothetical protein